MNPNTDPDVMHFSRDVLLPSIRKQLRDKFGMLTFDYGNVETRGKGGSRAWYTYGQEARYCTHYVGLRGRIAILSEATTFIPFKDRVVGTDRFVTSILEYVARHSWEVLDLTRKADARVVSWGLHPETAPELGVRFDFDSRGTETVLLEHPLLPGSSVPFGRPKALDKVTMPIYDRFKVTRSRKFPTAYLIPETETKVIDLLIKHGVIVERLVADWNGDGDQFSVTSVNVARGAFQGHKLVGLEGKFSSGQIEAKKGSVLVRTAQPLGVLAFHLLEAESLDGVVAWGFLSHVPQVGETFAISKSYKPVVVASTRIQP